MSLPTSVSPQFFVPRAAIGPAVTRLRVMTTPGRAQCPASYPVSDDAVRLTRQGLLRVDRLLPRFYGSHFRDVRYN
jgi:hypothetical protein